MKKRKIISLMLVAVLMLSLALTGCSSKKNDSKDQTDDTSTKATQAPASSESLDSGDATTDDSATVSRDPLTIEVYDIAANYQGIQSGWFGKVVKDKFNLELNIIAPQVSGDGDALYQTRTAAGALGDLILLDNADLMDCISAGLIMDITNDVQNATNLKQYYDQYKVYNTGMEGNADGKIYGLPCQITNTSPTTYSETEVYSSPMFPWDYYSELGNPEMKTLDDLLKVMEQIQKAHPTNDAGDPNYMLSLWSDWDGTSIETVNQITKWYGYEVDGSILLGTDGDMKELTDENGAYYKMLKFFNDANDKGLVDPDSGTQDWESACTKMKNKQVLLMWYNWQRGFWNTPDRANEKDAYIYAPVSDMNFYQTSDTFYGDGRAFAVGSQVDDATKARVIEFLDWLISTEGLNYLHVGLEDYNYTVNADGKYTMTEDGLYALMENREVPAEFGGGGYNDGSSKINQWPLAGVSINPLTGESYANSYWKSYLDANKTTMTNEWSAKYGVANQVELLTKNGQLDIAPSVNIILPSDTTDIALIRSQCGELVCDTSWRMIFASSEDEFKQMWSDMKTQLEGLGWKDLVAFDKEKYQNVVDARNAAKAQ